jgi:tight adherence protein B
MTVATAMAFAAGACAVLGAWDGLGAVDGRAPVRVVGRWLAPLRAGRPATPSELRRLTLVAAATLAAAGWLSAGPVLGLLLGAGGPLAARQATAMRVARRRRDVAAGAAAVARALADALAGGHSVRGAVTAAAASDGVPGAAGEELRRAAGALAVGEPTPAVLEALRRRACDPAWDTLCAAILLQERAGGDLARLLRDLALRLDEARRAEADARSATAQARLTAWIVAALPAAAAVLAELGAPGFLRDLLAQPLTASAIVLSILLQAMAVVAVRRIARPA